MSEYPENKINLEYNADSYSKEAGRQSAKRVRETNMTTEAFFDSDKCDEEIDKWIKEFSTNYRPKTPGHLTLSGLRLSMAVPDEEIKDFAYADKANIEDYENLGELDNRPYYPVREMGAILRYKDERFLDGEYGGIDIGNIVELPNAKVIGEKAFAGQPVITDVRIESMENVEMKEAAFAYCQNLRNVSMPRHMREVPDRAFKYCESLRSMELSPDTERIGEEAFMNCEKLAKAVVVPTKTKEIGDRAFKDSAVRGWNRGNNPLSKCENLERIGKEAFAGCGDIEYIAVPDSVKEVGDGAFRNTGLRDIDISDRLLASIDAEHGIDSVFADTNLDLAILYDRASIYEKYHDIPEIKKGNIEPERKIKLSKEPFVIGVEALADAGSDKIKKIDLGGCRAVSARAFCHTEAEISGLSSVEYVGNAAFAGNKKLEKANLSSAEHIGNAAFCGCSAMKEVTFSNNLKEVPARAFSDCISLTDVKLPDGLGYIGNKAFEGCESLRSITIPDSVKVIGRGAFAHCKNLESVVIPAGCEYISKEAFLGCKNLKNVVIPEGVKMIGDNAFAGCDALTEIVIPDSVEGLGSGTFACDNLTNVSISDELLEKADRRNDYGIRDIFTTSNSFARAYCNTKLGEAMDKRAEEIRAEREAAVAGQDMETKRPARNRRQFEEAAGLV